MDLGALVQTAMKAVPGDVKATVEFSRTEQNYNASTGKSTPTKTSIFGTASEGSRNPEVYRALSLVAIDAPSLIFVPDVVGDLPQLGDECSWNQAGYVVKAVTPIAPRGVAVAAVVVVSR